MPETAVKRSFQPSADLTGVADTVGELRSLAAQAGIVEEQITFAALCLEEAITNVVMHGVADIEHPHIDVTLTLSASHVTMQITDNGIPFDPTRHTPSETAQSLLTAEIGGFGVRLMSEYAETMEYQRDQGRNVLTLGCGLPPIGATQD